MPILPGTKKEEIKEWLIGDLEHKRSVVNFLKGAETQLMRFKREPKNQYKIVDPNSEVNYSKQFGDIERLKGEIDSAITTFNEIQTIVNNIINYLPEMDEQVNKTQKALNDWKMSNNTLYNISRSSIPQEQLSELESTVVLPPPPPRGGKNKRRHSRRRSSGSRRAATRRKK